MEKTRFTPHALIRLSERTAITPQSLSHILDCGEFISLGKALKSNRLSKLFFSKSDDQFFIAVQERDSGYVVTILTLEYWHNLSEKFFEEKLVVTRKELLRAIKIGDPDNELLIHPPFTLHKVLNFQVQVINRKDLFEYPKLVNIGGMDLKLFLDNTIEDIVNLFESKITEKLTNKNISEQEVIAIRWGLGRDPKINEIKIYETVPYYSLVSDIKDDLYLRDKLFKKYDDFLEILNRQKKVTKKLQT